MREAKNKNPTERACAALVIGCGVMAGVLSAGVLIWLMVEAVQSTL
jgi:hypothetical protein